MHILKEAVQKAELLVDGCGYEVNAVTLCTDTNTCLCMHEAGMTVRASFGGRSADFVTDTPTEARTKLSYLFDAPLTKRLQQSAAAAVLNVLSGFLCMSRRLHACSPEKHAACISELQERIQGKTVYCAGTLSAIREAFPSQITTDISTANLILVSGDGILGEEGQKLGDIRDTIPNERILFIGPSAAGVSSMLHHEHFCPYGRA